MSISINPVGTSLALQQPSYSTKASSAATSFSDLLKNVMGAETEITFPVSGNSSVDSLYSSPPVMVQMMLDSSIDGGSSDVLANILMFLLLDRDCQLDGDVSLYSADKSVDEGALPIYKRGPHIKAKYEDIVHSAMTRLGDPYSQAKAGQGDYTDCSYLTRWCYREVGLELPRTAAAQAKYCVDNGITVSKDELRPGDLVFFSLKENDRFMNISHVGIYAGNGMMVDASSSNGEVVYRQMFDNGQVLYGRPSLMLNKS